MGRSPEGMKRYLAASRERKRRLRKDPEYLKKEAAKALERYHADKAVHQQRTRDWQKKNRGRQNAWRKKKRSDNIALFRDAERRGYKRTVRAAVAKFRRGDIGLAELNLRFGKALARCNEVTGVAEDSSRHPGDLRAGQGDSGPTKTST